MWGLERFKSVVRVGGKGVFSFRMNLKVLTADLKTSVY